jgi:hypothetical protein
MTIVEKPFLPSDLRKQPNTALFRAAAAAFQADVFKRHYDQFLDRDDVPARLLLRSAQSPAMIGSGGWANALAQTAVYDALVGIGGPSAAAELIRMGLRLDFGRQAAISVPTRIVAAADAGGFVVEGSPIAVRQLSLSAGTLSPMRLAVIITMSELAAETSNTERVVTQLLGEAFRLRLDAELFSNTAGSTSRPAGLLNSVTPLIATAAGSEAQEKDIAQLVAALNTAGGGANPVFICSPPQAATLKLRAGTKFDYPILSSGALANGTIAAVEASGFVSVIDPAPDFLVSNSTLLHMEDATPLPLAAGTGPTVASPQRSLYQTAAKAIRMIVNMSWTMRASGLVQVINSVNW